jgi:hypothetical protein
MTFHPMEITCKGLSFCVGAVQRICLSNDHFSPYSYSTLILTTVAMEQCTDTRARSHVPEIRTSPVSWAQLSRLHLRTETECNLQNLCFKLKGGGGRCLIPRNTVIVYKPVPLPPFHFVIYIIENSCRYEHTF